MYVVARTDSIHSILSLSLSLSLSSDTSTNLSLPFFPLLSNGGGKQSPAGKRIEKREKSFFPASLSPSFFSWPCGQPPPGEELSNGRPTSPSHTARMCVYCMMETSVSTRGFTEPYHTEGKREEGMEGPVLLLPPPPIIPPFLPPSVRPPTAMLNMQAYIHRPRTARVKGGGG